MIIDFHSHVQLPSEQAHPRWQGRCPMTIENVLAAMETAGVDLNVISNTSHFVARLGPEEALARQGELNRYLAELQDRHSGKIVALAASVANGGPAYHRELERAVKEDGLKGVMIPSSYQGRYPDDDDAWDFFALACALDIPVVIHPPPVGFGEERMRDYRLASSVGRPFDSCLAIARLLVRGVFERFPDLKLVATHLGGGIGEIIGRLDYAYRLGDEAFFLGSYEPMLIGRSPLEYLKMMHVDTVCYYAPAARCALETWGADHILFGSDAPPLTPLKPEAVDLVKGLALSPEDEAKVFAGNARRLLKLD